jgi:hypothetical protein
MRDVKKINLTYWGVAIGLLITSFLIDIPEKKMNISLLEIEALANSEFSDGPCSEYLMDVKYGDLTDGGNKVIFTYGCAGNSSGVCRKGKVVEYYGLYGQYIGEDDQRISTTCE